jgi:hypothetical protein
MDQLYVPAQLTRHIRPELRSLGTASDNTVDAYDPAALRLVLVAANTGTAQTITFDLTRFATVIGCFPGRIGTNPPTPRRGLTSVGMAGKRASRRVSPARRDAFVHRFENYDRRRDWLTFLAVCGGFAFLPTAMVLLIGTVVEIFGSFYAEHWPTIVIVGAFGTVVLALFAGFFAASMGEADREGIKFILDEEGVYLGGLRPCRVAWRDVTEVVLTTQTNIHIRSGQKSVNHYVDFRLNGSRRRARRTGLDAAGLEKVRSTIQRHAPAVKVTVREKEG